VPHHDAETARSLRRLLRVPPRASLLALLAALGLALSAGAAPARACGGHEAPRTEETAPAAEVDAPVPVPLQGIAVAQPPPSEGPSCCGCCEPLGRRVPLRGPAPPAPSLTGASSSMAAFAFPVIAAPSFAQDRAGPPATSVARYLLLGRFLT